MFPGQNNQLSAWPEALAEAAQHLRDATPGSLLFYEVREDLRALVDSEGVGRVVRTLSTGLAGRRGLEPALGWYRSAPDPEHATGMARLVSGRLDGGEAEEPATERNSFVSKSSADSRIAAELRLLVGEALAAAGDDASVTATCVASDQRVHVVVAGMAEAAADHRTGRRWRVEVQVRQGDSLAGAGAEATDCTAAPAGLGETAAHRAVERLKARPARPGETIAVFAPGVGGVLAHELVGHASEGDVVPHGGSWIDRTRPAVAAAGLTVIDDPTRGRAPWRIDDEGSEAAAVTLIRDGTAEGMLHDLRSASAEGVPSTGHGRRASFREPVRPRLGCTFIAPGRYEADEVWADVASGVYVRRMEAASVDACSGEAWFLVTDADEIVGGRIAAPLDPFLLTLQARRALPAIDRIANDLTFDTCTGNCVRDGQTLITSVGAPTIRTRLATVVL